MAASAILDMLGVYWDQPRRLLGGLYRCAKFGLNRCSTFDKGWWRGSVVERRSLAGELSLSCARPAADG